MKKICPNFLFVVFLCFLAGTVNAQEVLGYFKVHDADGPLILRVISVANASDAGNGVIKVALPGGVIGAADLVETGNSMASPVRVKTPYGIHAWRKESLFSYVYGGTGADLFTGLALTNDGGIILGGYTNSWGSGYYDQMMIKTDLAGSITWSGVYGDAQSETGQSVIQKTDGGYLVLGTASSGSESYMYLNFINSSGSSTLDGYFLTPTGYTYGNDVIQCEDGNFIGAGHVTGFGAGGYDAYVKKFTSSGGNVWGYAIGSIYDEVAKEIVQRADGGYAVTGYVTDENSDYDVYFLMLDAEGNPEIAYSLGGSSGDYAEAICKADDNGFVTIGRTWSFGSGSWDYYLIKRASNGDYSWAKAIGGTGADLGEDIACTNDGGFILTGKTDSFGAGGLDLWLVKTDSFGNAQWSWVFGGTGNEAGYAVRQGSDGCFYVGGIASSYGAGGNDALLVKFTQDGSTCLGYAIGFTSSMMPLDEENSMFKAQHVENFNVTIVNDEERTLGASSVTLQNQFVQSSRKSRDFITPTITTVCN